MTAETGLPPARVPAAAGTMLRRPARMSAMVKSATDSLFAPGVFVTRTPRAAVARRSTASTPTP